MKIGIIGQGYVGTAIKVGFEPHYELETYDKYDKDKSTCDNLFDLVMECDVMFVCVPTPMNKDGSCHTDIVEDVVKEINKWSYAYWGNKNIKPTVVIKIKCVLKILTTLNWAITHHISNTSVMISFCIITIKRNSFCKSLHSFKMFSKKNMNRSFQIPELWLRIIFFNKVFYFN